MKNRKNLHDYGLVLVVLGVLNLFMFVSTVVAGLVDGTVTEALATVDAEILVAVKVMLGVIGGLMGLIVLADVLIGMKALKVSKNPNADKGYITAAKVFFVMSVISAISAVVTLFDGSAPIVDTILNLANAALGAVVYVLFIKAAQGVRRDVLNGAK
jgi:uncharacterized membrane-anchored protein